MFIPSPIGGLQERLTEVYPHPIFSQSLAYPDLMSRLVEMLDRIQTQKTQHELTLHQQARQDHLDQIAEQERQRKDTREDLQQKLDLATLMQGQAAKMPLSQAQTTSLDSQPLPELSETRGGLSRDEADYIGGATKVPKRQLVVPGTSIGDINFPLQYEEEARQKATDKTAEAQAQALDLFRQKAEISKDLKGDSVKPRIAAEGNDLVSRNPDTGEENWRVKGAGKQSTPNEKNPIAVQVYNRETNNVETRFVTAAQANRMAETGETLTRSPGATVQNRRDAAHNSIKSANNLIGELEDPEFSSQIGPIMGRYNSLKAAAGAGDPHAQYLVGALNSYAALQPQIHGFRSAEFADRITKLINTKQTPESLIAEIQGINTAAEIVARGETENVTPGKSRKSEAVPPGGAAAAGGAKSSSGGPPAGALTATNKKTGKRAYSTDGGKSWTEY